MTGRLSLRGFVMYSTLMAARVAAQAATPDLSAQDDRPIPPAATSGTAGQAQTSGAPSAQPAAGARELLVPPSDELQAPREAPPPNNPYPANHGAFPRRWNAADTARVRLMLEAERARRGRLQSRAGTVPASQPEPVVHGDAGAAIGIGLSVDAVFHDDVGFKLFDENKATSRLGLWASHDLATLTKRWIIAGELGFGLEGNDGTRLFSGDGEAHLHATTFHGALSLRWDACAVFAPHVRASGGVSALDLELQLGGGEAKETDHAASGFGALGAGFLLHTPARLFESRAGKVASLSLGVMFEAGYALRSPVEFALKNKGDSRSIEIINAKLGRLDLSGAYLRTSLVARF